LFTVVRRSATKKKLVSAHFVLLFFQLSVQIKKLVDNTIKCWLNK